MPAGPIAKRHRMGANGVDDVVLLPRRFRTYGAPSIRKQNILAQKRGANSPCRRSSTARSASSTVGAAPRSGHLYEVSEKGGQALDLERVAREHDEIAAHGDPRGKRLLYRMQHAVLRTDDHRRIDMVGNGECYASVVMHGRHSSKDAGPFGRACVHLTLLRPFDTFHHSRSPSASNPLVSGTRKMNASELARRRNG